MEIMGNLRHLGLISPSCRLYELEVGHTTPLDSMAGFEKIISHTSQLDTQDRERDNLHREGPENLSDLCGNLVELRWLWAEVWP